MAVNTEPLPPDPLYKFSIKRKDRLTSISIEPEFLAILRQMARNREISINVMINRLADEPKRQRNLSRHLRLCALRWCLKQIPTRDRPDDGLD